MTRIAIIGGGIGGLTAALALRQFGFNAEVFEQAPELLEVGAAIAIWPNAMRLLVRLGLGDQIMQHAGVIEQVRWLDSSGRLLNSTQFPKSDAPAVALRRADLQSALSQALPGSCIELGKHFQEFQASNEIIARFTNGSAAVCDCLLGCDGLHSRVRAQIVDDRAPAYRGYAVWRGTAAISLSELPAKTAMEIYGAGKRFGIGPVGGNRIGWWATANQNIEPGAQRIADADDHNWRSDSQQDLLKLFSGWYQPVLELIQATTAESMVKTAAFDRPVTRTWGAGTVTLLGDAIHPMTPNLGQGGCMAIEDAVILARCLQKYGPGQEGLRNYEKLRYTRTKAVAGYSRIYGDVGQWQNPWATRCRRSMLSLAPQFVTRRLLRLIFDYDAYAVNV